MEIKSEFIGSPPRIWGRDDNICSSTGRPPSSQDGTTWWERFRRKNFQIFFHGEIDFPFAMRSSATISEFDFWNSKVGSEIIGSPLGVWGLDHNTCSSNYWLLIRIFPTEKFSYFFPERSRFSHRDRGLDHRIWDNV